MKALRLIHRWIGLLTGLFLFLLCISGSMIIVGKLVGSHAPIFGWCMRLHRSLFLGATGHTIVGIATLLTVVEIISGYWMWVNIARKSGVRALKWTFPNKLIGLHNGAGIWAGIPLLLMALTGLTWSFGWYADVIYTLFDPDGTRNLFHTIIGLHTGSLISRWVWLAAALLASSLPITGLLISLKKIKRSDGGS